MTAPTPTPPPPAPTPKPNPGSAAAVALGCTCAVLDNNHGHWAPFPPDGWWTTANCPLHSLEPS